MKKIIIQVLKISFIIFIFFLLPIITPQALALEPGTILYRTTQDGKMYGYNSSQLLEVKNGILNNINPGHVGLYIGEENGEHYVVEALAGGVVKTPAKYFVNTNLHEKLVGAKIPKEASVVDRLKAVKLAKSLVGMDLGYDFDFRKQKGPGNGDWTCVGLVEKIYESINKLNPLDWFSLEYNPNYYGIDITPDGFDNSSVINADGDTFSRRVEFSKVAPYRNILLPLPEIIGYNAGLEHQGERYIFFPYTQFVQNSLQSKPVDIQLSSNFDANKVRGKTPATKLILRWSLINNPISSIKQIATKTSQSLKNYLSAIFGKEKAEEMVLIEQDNNNYNNYDNYESEFNHLITINTQDPKTAAANLQQDNKTSSELSQKNNNDSKIKININTSDFASNVKDDSLEYVSDSKLQKQNNNDNDQDNNLKHDNSQVNTAVIYNPSEALSSKITVLTKVNKTSGNNTNNNNYNNNNNVNTNNNLPKPTVLISKIYATGDNDFIELYNPLDYDFDLAEEGFRLERSKTAEDPSIAIRIGHEDDGYYPGGTTIKAKSYYLIVREDAAKYYLDLADAIATRKEFSWTGSGYIIYLGNGAISSSVDEDIIDAVGFGAAKYFQGSAPAPVIPNNYFLSRKSNFYDNFLDFELLPIADPDVVWDDSNNNDSNSRINENNNNDNQTEDDDKNDNDEEDNEEDNSDVTNKVNPTALISKIYATGNNDFIELYNPLDYDFDLAEEGFRLERAKTADDPSIAIRIGHEDDGYYPGGTMIKAKSHYLIVREDASEYYLDLADAVATRKEFSWTGSGYIIYLGNGAISSSVDEDIIDAVGFGEAKYFQGSAPAPVIPDNYFLNRISNFYDNFLDFELLPIADPDVIWDEDDDFGYTNLADDFIPFEQGTPFLLDGLVYLRNFAECYSNNDLNYGVGKFDCGVELGSNYSQLETNFSQEIDLNSFSLGFFYRNTKNSSNHLRLNLTLSNDTDQYLDMEFNHDFIKLSGFSTIAPTIIYPVFAGDKWHHFTLVIDKINQNLKIYLDGEELGTYLLIETLAANINNLKIKASSYGITSVGIDELFIANIPVNEIQIQDYLNQAAPLAPNPEREEQLPAKLKYYWDFNEGHEFANEGGGLIARDKKNNLEIILPKKDWVWREAENSAIKTYYPNHLSVRFPEPLERQDISLAYWWRSELTKNKGGRTKILLKNDSLAGLGLTAALNGRFYYFNSNDEKVLTYAEGDHFPNDDEWHFITLTYDSFRYSLKIYVDGELMYDLPHYWMLKSNLPDQLVIHNELYGVELDDLSIWEGILTPNQIIKLMNEVSPLDL